MTAFTQVPSLVTFTPLTTILSADVNANYAAIRNVVNGLVSGSNTIAVDTITENTAAAGVTVNKKFLLTGPSLNVSGVAVSGIATFTSGFAVSGGVVSGSATFSSGFAVTAGVPTFTSGITVTGAATFAGGWVLSGGTINVSGATVSGQATFSSGMKVVGGLDNATGGAFFNTATFGTQITVATGAQVILAVGTLATSATLGFIYIATASATMTSTPAAATGGVPLVYDITNNRLQIYNGGWKSVALT